MALCESFNQRMRGKRQCRIVILISANISGAGGTNRKALKPSRAITRDPGSWRKHFWVANADSWPCLSEYGLGKKYMCVIMTCNSYHGSSVARVKRGVGGPIASPISLSTKTQNKKNTTFLGLLRLFFALEWTKKWFRASFATYLQKRLICQKLKSQINKNFEKCPKIKNQ